jgi:hypothetical protein
MVYNIHALVNNYRYFQDKPSLDAARKLGDYILRNRKGSGPPRDNGKINTERAMIALSEATGDARYRDDAVNGMDLRHWKTPVAGHAYMFMNICLAQLDLYREEPDESLLAQSRKVIDYLTKNDGLMISGTCSLWETFHDNQETRGRLGESCATAYLIRMAHYLLQLEGKSLDGDIMERAIYNALFAAQSPDGRMLRYFTCIDGPRAFFDRDIYCCPGNWRRIVAELPEMIYYRSADGGVLVNLYTASSAELPIANDLSVRLRQETDYPNSGKVILTVEPSRTVEFPVILRIPRWCETAAVFVNGQPVAGPAKSGDWFTIKRSWKAGDVVTLDMPMKTRLVRGRKLQEGKVAVMRGPVVFCYSPSRNKELVQLRARLDEVSSKLGLGSGDPLNLADIVAGGNGSGNGRPGHSAISDGPFGDPETQGNGIDVSNGRLATGPFNNLAVTANKFVTTDHPLIHGVVIPNGGKDGQTPVPITATGLTATVPGTSGQTRDLIRSGPVARQRTTVAGNVDYAGGQHTMLSLHANKAITFDLAAVRKASGYGEMRLRTKACYGGQPEPTVDYAVLVDGKPAIERKALTRQPQEIDVALPVGTRFLTLVVTDQNSDMSHDQAFFGDAVLAPVGFKPSAEAALLLRERQTLQAKIAQYPSSADAQGKMKLDMTSLSSLVPDKTVRPDGLAMEVRSWGPASDRSKPADVPLLLTEYIDPAGEMTYFPVDDAKTGVEDELYAAPRPK